MFRFESERVECPETIWNLDSYTHNFEHIFSTKAPISDRINLMIVHQIKREFACEEPPHWESRPTEANGAGRPNDEIAQRHLVPSENLPESADRKNENNYSYELYFIITNKQYKIVPHP